MEDGSLIVYEAFEDFGYATLRPGSDKTLALRWVKVQSQALGTAKRARTTKDGDSMGPAARRFVPFSRLSGYDGVYITGENPCWLLKDDVAPCRMFESAFKPAYGFTSYRSKCLISLGEVSHHWRNETDPINY